MDLMRMSEMMLIGLMVISGAMAWLGREKLHYHVLELNIVILFMVTMLDCFW